MNQYASKLLLTGSDYPDVCSRIVVQSRKNTVTRDTLPTGYGALLMSMAYGSMGQVILPGGPLTMLDGNEVFNTGFVEGDGGVMYVKHRLDAGNRPGTGNRIQTVPELDDRIGQFLFKRLFDGGRCSPSNLASDVTLLQVHGCITNVRVRDTPPLTITNCVIGCPVMSSALVNTKTPIALRGAPVSKSMTISCTTQHCPSLCTLDTG